MSALKKTQNVNFRVDPETHELLQRAAEVCGKSVTAFITEAATYAAQKELMDQRFIGVSSDVFDSVVEQLDAPVTINDKLVELMKRNREWVD